MNKQMSKSEFEEYYAANSHMTVDKLTYLGFIAVPCDCGGSCCHGWQMTLEDNDLEDIKSGILHAKNGYI